MAGRIALIDQARGIAVIGMVIFNYAFALTYLGKANFPVYDGVFWWFARIIAFAFIFIAGLSVWLSYQKNIKQIGWSKTKYKLLKRGVWIFFLGMLITIATWFYEPKATIWFGILHLIGIGTIISVPIIRANKKIQIALLAPLLILGGFLIFGVNVDFPYLLWLGLWPNGRYTFDYFPILPWFGFFLLGILFGKVKFANIPAKGYGDGYQLGFLNPVAFLGRHSLAIYLLHQPILLLAIKISGI
jgi:uncharacterized membrane protein